MRNEKGVIFAVLFVSLCVIGMAHGVSHQVIGGGVGVQVRYDDGSPISFSEFKVFSPSDRETAYQEGLTDKNGRFLFFPDEAGKWKVSVSDGMGHGMVTEIQVDTAGMAPASEGGGMSRFQKILMGISVILGITGILFFVSARKHYLKK